MLNITSEQLALIKKYMPDCSDYISNDELDNFLDKFDDVITEVGFDDEYELTSEGLQLQKVYDQIYNQNK